MDVLYPRCCGLDIHQKTVVACLITTEEGQQPVKVIRTFRTMTVELLVLADWLHTAACTHVAMESTGVSWRPIDNLLEGLFELLVVNAQHIKAMPGRKTDVKDAEWIAELLRHGLLRGSFIPSKPQRQLRELTRHRTTLVQDRARVINRLQAVLEDANIKLAAVVTDIRGGSARAMLEALIAGQRDVDTLAELARGRLRTKRDQLAEALQGYLTSHHSFLVTEYLSQIDYLDGAIDRVSALIAWHLEAEQEAIALLDTIHGVSQRTAEILLAEIGTDMTRFPSAKHLASWAGMCPGHSAEEPGNYDEVCAGVGGPVGWCTPLRCSEMSVCAYIFSTFLLCISSLRLCYALAARRPPLTSRVSRRVSLSIPVHPTHEAQEDPPMDNLLARVEDLERQARTVEQRLRWWRGLALALLVLGLVSWNLPDLIAASKPDLESRVAALESLLKHFSRDGDEITIKGANLNIVNGVGAQEDCGVKEATDPVCPHNGLGNLTIGYNEPRGDGTDVRTGSHNLVMGRFNNYSGGTGNLIGGYFNEVFSHNSMIFGGSFNRLFGEASVLLAGNSNEITPEGRWAGLFTGGGNRVENQAAAVFGGLGNIAAGGASAIVGGLNNRTSAFDAEGIGAGHQTIVGADSGFAQGSYSNIHGGFLAQTLGHSASVFGGYQNRADSFLSAILGGNTNFIEGPFGAAYSAICGGQGNRTTAQYATVTGGQHNIAGGEWSVVSGGQERSVDGNHDWRAGNLFQDE